MFCGVNGERCRNRAQTGEHKAVVGRKVHVPRTTVLDTRFALVCLFFCSNLQNDEKMNEVMNLAHTFLQNFCRGNPQNQVLLHKHLNLFLTPGVGILVTSNTYSKVSIQLIIAAVT